MWQLLKKWVLAVYFAFLFIINSFVPSTGDRIQVIGHSVLFKVRLCSSKLSLRLTPKCLKASLLYWVVPLPGEIHSSLSLDSIGFLLCSGTKAASAQLTTLTWPICTSNLNMPEKGMSNFPPKKWLLTYSSFLLVNDNLLRAKAWSIPSLSSSSHVTSHLTADLVDSICKMHL